MNIRKAAKLIGPLKLKDTALGLILVDLVNEVLPRPLHLSPELTGLEALGRINNIPDMYRSEVISIEISEALGLDKLKREIKNVKRREGVVDKGLYRPFIVTSSILILIFAFVMVFSYAVTSLSRNEPADPTSLLLLLDVIIELLQISE